MDGFIALKQQYTKIYSLQNHVKSQLHIQIDGPEAHWCVCKSEIQFRFDLKGPK